MFDINKAIRNMNKKCNICTNKKDCKRALALEKSEVQKVQISLTVLFNKCDVFMHKLIIKESGYGG